LSAAVGALFFGIHPLRVEPVAWATDLQDLLCGIFFQLAVLAYLRMVAAHRPAAASGWYLLSLSSFALSLLSKAARVMLPAVLLAPGIYPLRRLMAAGGRRYAALILEKIPYVQLAAGAVVVAVVAKEQRAMVPLARHGVVQRVMQAVYGLCF